MTQEDKLFEILIEKVKAYHPKPNLELLEKAYNVAKEAHGPQLRKSGEPYIIHPVNVAIILAELELDTESIASALLHDVIEDTKYDYDDIVNMFSEEIAIIVSGVTKLTNMEYEDKEEEQAENYRKMFLASAKDIRIILVKVADRLHNMRTLNFMKPSKQREKAQETQDIYAPICARLGISKIRYEMEDLCLMYLHPNEYEDLSSKINLKKQERASQVDKIVKELSENITNAGIKATIEGRSKHLFSIYRKMVKQGKTLDQIFDLVAVRVLVDKIEDCYSAVGIIHQYYNPIPGRFKDYISVPKPNGYQSLHNTLVSTTGIVFEVQIRTHEMHRVGEYGIAAHWKYKSGSKNSKEKSGEEEKLNWLKKLLEWQKDFDNNGEYLQAIKGDLNLYQDRVYCFTPGGKIIDLVSDSTPIDFAYAIHSAIGNKMVGAKVNGAIVPITTKLKIGDRVEIITSQNSTGPSRDWLSYVATTQAKNKINTWFKKRNKEENIERGIEMLEKEAKRKGYKLSELLNKNSIEVVLNRYAYKEWDTLCASVGYSAVKEGQVINRLVEEYKKVHEKLEKNNNELLEKLKKETEERKEKNKSNKQNHDERTKKFKNGVMIKDSGFFNATFSRCCTPVPGDEIVAFVRRGRGLAVHRTDCVNIINATESEKSRIYEAYWPKDVVENKNQIFNVGLNITCFDRALLLSDLTHILSEEKIDITSINTRTAKDDVIFFIELKIKSIEQLEKVTKKFRQLEGVYDVSRVTN